MSGIPEASVFPFILCNRGRHPARFQVARHISGAGALGPSIAALAILLCVSVPASAQFTTVWSSVETENSAAAVWGDYDGDGDLDIAVANEGGSTPKRVYRNDGGGAFSLDRSSSDTYSTRFIHWGDYDGDGDLDLAAAHPNNENRVYANDGAGGFAVAWTSVEVDNSLSMIWGDIDADGDLDMGVCSFGANRIYRNDGGDAFTSVWVSTETENSVLSDWGDVDGDGDLDWAVGNINVASRVYANDGTGGFASAWVAADQDPNYFVALGDYDGDGDLDLASANSPGWENRVYQNDGTGNFTSIWMSTETDNSVAVSWGDYDGDGDLDLSVGNNVAGQANRVYRNDGNDAFALAWSTTEVDSTISFEWGDYDDDGDLDLLAANKLAKANRVYRNDLNPANAAPSAPSANAAADALAENGAGAVLLTWSPGSDVETTNADQLTYDVRIGTASGGCDVFCGFFPASGTAPYRGNSFGNADGNLSMTIELPMGDYYWNVRTVDATFVRSDWSAEGAFSVDDPLESSWTSDEIEQGRTVRWGDYDGDGDLDIAKGSIWGVNHVYANDGSGVLSLVWTSNESDETYAMEWGDYDGDGDLDIGVGNSPTRADRVYENNDAGGFTLVWTSVEEESTAQACWGDFDGDGGLEFLAGNLGEAHRLYKHVGGGSFESVWTSAEAELSRGIGCGDFDADGGVDFAAANIGAADRVYKNDGYGSLTSYWTSPEVEQSWGAAFGDYDGDGDLDLAIANNGAGDRMYENTGSSFSSVWTSSDAGYTWRIKWGDYDGDGDLDFTTVNVIEQNNHLYRNEGDVSFPLVWTSPEAEGTHEMDWGDMDDDGDLDLATANDDGNLGEPLRLYRNTLNPTNTIPTTPSPAQPLDVAVEGATASVSFSWSAGSDAETTDADVLTYDVRLGTTEGGCDVFCGAFPASGTIPYRANGFGNVYGATIKSFDLAPGGYYWNVRTVDATFMRSPWSGTIKIVLDGNGPDGPDAVNDGDILGVDLDVANSLTDLSANWAAAADGETDVALYWLSFGTAPGASDTAGWMNAGAETVWTASGLSLTEGETYYATVVAQNGVGLLGTQATSDGITVDVTPPACELIAPAHGANLNSRNVAGACACDDPSIAVTIGGEPAIWNASTGMFETSFDEPEGFGRFIACEAIDHAGNSASQTVEIDLDATGPGGEIESPAEGGVAAGEIEVVGSIFDSLSGVSSWALKFKASGNSSLAGTISQGDAEASGETLGQWDASCLSGDYVLTLQAEDAFGNATETAEWALTVNNPQTESGSIPAERWEFLSVPIDVQGAGSKGGANRNDLFGDRDDYKIYRWDNAKEERDSLGRYYVPEDLNAGDGFWAKAFGESAVDYSYSGEAVETTGSFEIPIQEGMNQIGSPFVCGYEWANVKVKSAGGQVYALSEAVNAGLLAPSIDSYEYDAAKGAGGWEQLSGSVFMEHGKGYAVSAYEDATLIFEPGQTGVSAARIVRPKERLRVRLSASAGRAADRNNYFIVQTGAAAGLDPYDQPEPPAAPPGAGRLSLYFPHENWPRAAAFAGRFENDARPAPANGAAKDWTFVVETDQAGEEAVLEWAIEGCEGCELILTDKNTGEAVDMFAEGEFRYMTADGDAQTERLFIVSARLALNDDIQTGAATVPAGWSLAAFPYHTDQTGAAAQLGDDLPGPAVFQHYAGRYYAKDQTDIQAGVGYWIHAESETELDVEGTPVGAGETVSTPLSRGMNLVGNPYDQNLSWGDNISFVCGGESKPLSKSAEAGWTNGMAYLYGGERYQLMAPGGVVGPWTGFFVLAGRSDCEIVFSAE